MKYISVNGKQIAPSKVVCVGRNYVEHIRELNNEVPDEMVLFIKPNSAVSHELIAFHQEPLHYEGEICFVYHQGKFNAVGFGLDLTKRTLQAQLKSKGLPWERAKAFDGSAVFSEFVSIDNIEDSLSLQLSINGKMIQQGNVTLMMNKPDEILAEIQHFLTLEDGDIVMTGTPKGVGVIEAGDQYNAKVFTDKRVFVNTLFTAK